MSPLLRFELAAAGIVVLAASAVCLEIQLGRRTRMAAAAAALESEFAEVRAPHATSRGRARVLHASTPLLPSEDYGEEISEEELGIAAARASAQRRRLRALRDSWQEEPVDLAWAPELERALQTALTDAGAPRSLVCRTRLCRVTFDEATGLAAAQALSGLALERGAALWLAPPEQDPDPELEQREREVFLLRLGAEFDLEELDTVHRGF